MTADGIRFRGRHLGIASPWVALALAAVLTAPGCSPNVKDCVGGMNGGYAGSMAGSMDATLDKDGALTFTLYDDNNGDVVAYGTGTITDEGAARGTAGDLSFSGQTDFGACLATGSWSSTGDDSENGTWQLER